MEALMSRSASVEARVARSPHYTWEGRDGRGYHINGVDVSGSVLKQTVIASFGTLSEGALIADFGCGEGRVRQEAPSPTDRSYAFVGFELNPAAVRRYQEDALGTSDNAVVADLTRLCVGSEIFDAALCWRVLHSIPARMHETALKNVADSLKPGASLHVAARSDRDWVAVDLRSRGFYTTGKMNECFPAMAEALGPQRISSWPLYFFEAGELARLGERAGLAVACQRPIEEPSGFKALQDRPFLSYDYVEFVKL